MSGIKILFELFAVFFKIGAVTFGGGIAMLPILERELSDKRKWVSSDELLDYFAIGQSTPGIIAVNVATFVGFKKNGILGGIVATFGIVCPSLIIITAIALFINNFSQIEWVRKALVGINISVAALLTYSVINFAKKSVKGIIGVIFFLISFLLIFVLKVNTVFVILGSAILGIIIFGFLQKDKQKD